MQAPQHARRPGEPGSSHAAELLRPTRIGITCALCHSTVNNSLTKLGLTVQQKLDLVEYLESL
jgi:hypothetical protein